jgi:4-aminobutyrate aminotransferase-like enzyme
MTRLLEGDFVYRHRPPILVTETAGCVLRTAERDYIDLQAASGAAILGYDPRLLARLDLESGPLSKPQTCESRRRIALGARLEVLIAEAQGRRGRVGFELGGAQGIELAIKIVLSAHKRLTLFTIEGAYHGRSLFTSHLSSSRRYTLGTHLGMPVVRLPNPHFVADREGLSIEQATAICLRQVRMAFEDERLGVCDPMGSLPVLIYESIQNVAGMLDLPAPYLAALEELVHATGGVSIADEIFAGMYRFGPMFAHQAKDLRPDIGVFSKGLTNGLAPLSAIWVAEESGLSDSFAAGTHSCTYLNYELGLIIADRVLDRVAALDLRRVHSLGHSILQRIEAAAPRGLITGRYANGAVARIDLAEAELARRLSTAMLNAVPLGVLHATTGLARKSIILHPPYVISDDDLDRAAEVIEVAMRQFR